MISRERLQTRFLEMIQVSSPSKKEKDMVEWLERYFTERGISFRTDEAGQGYGGNGKNLVAHIPGTLPGDPIGFMAHTDQIEPCDNIHAIVEGDIIRTDGTTTLGGDDKGGITAILEAVEDLLETKAPHRDLYLVFSCSEEISMQGTKHMDLDMLPCKDLVVPDATGNTGVIAYKAPAMEAIRATFHGKKAHAGIEPEKGINAIVAAAKAISAMHIGRLSPETTSNIGRIEGGDATNVVTDSVYFTAEIRSHSMDVLHDEVAYMEQCCRKAAEEMGATVDFCHELSYPTLNVPLDSNLVRMTVKAMEDEGVTPNCMIIGGGSDANILAGHGYRSVILGLGMRDVHTVDESLDMSEVLKCIKVMRRMMSMLETDLL